MILKLRNISYILLLYTSHIFPHSESNLPAQNNYWVITSGNAIIWNVISESRLPHADNIEMAGKRIAAIIDYSIDENKQLSLKRDIIFPQLRVFTKTNEPEWKVYRAYLRHSYTDDILPVITSNDKIIVPGSVDSVKIEGKLVFYHHPVQDVAIKRTLFPSMSERLFVEKCELHNISNEAINLKIGKTVFEQQETGHKGKYMRKVYSDAEDEITIPAQSEYTFAIYFTARLNNENPVDQSFDEAESERDIFLKEMRDNLILKSPDEIVNTLFYFSKIRATENIFESKMGLVHSPGGGNYYVGVWANDQVEYSGPFFPFLGYEQGNTAAYNAYKIFMKHIPEDGSNIWSSFEMEGDLTCCGKDRGDAAMIAYGTSQFLLARGDQSIATELWPLVEWSLDYCHKMKNEAGAIESDTDEMEGRISTGSANLATSSLYYGGLKFAAHLAHELGKKQSAMLYSTRADEMVAAIEDYFGAEMDGLHTYRYFDGNKHLRHWICLPLVMGIDNRAEGTIDALFNKLWTENGVLVEYKPQAEGPRIFWDRATLYALRGALKAGATELAIDRLTAFSQKRLIGDHVPYVIEAFPENNMRHLSAESALYCRIFIEGLLGLEQIGFRSFTITPKLPDEWDYFSLEHIKAFNSNFTISLARNDNLIQVRVFNYQQNIYDKAINSGEKIEIRL